MILAAIVGINRIKLSDFNPINGDFQNYNPVRRLLDGQIPFKDFTVYLGTGHLFLLSAIQLIVGNNYTASQLTKFAISFFIMKDKRKALYLTLFITLINLVRPKFIINSLESIFVSALNFGNQPGLSARLIRMAIIPIIALIIYLGFKFIKNTKNKFIIKHKDIIWKIYIAIIAGMSILWSNDGGIAAYISVSFMYFLLLIKEYKKDIKHIILYTLMYIAISFISFMLLLTVITRGNVLSWFEFTLGVSSYQKWYYLEATTKENVYLYNIDLTLYNVFMIIIAFYYICKTLKVSKKSDIIRYSLLNVIIIGSLISAYLYQLLSGGESKEMLNLVLLIWIFAHIYQLISKAVKNKKEYPLKLVIILISCGVIISNLYNQFSIFRNRDEYTYIKELGGYFSEFGEDIKNAIKRVGDEKIFSTYATAIESGTDQFQPSGIDYIIHCMGDKQREDYLKSFREGQFKYVTTTDRDYTSCRYWIKNANWFFYRELYENYKPVFATEYNMFWEKSNESNKLEDVKQATTLTLSKKDNSKYKLKVKTSDSKFSGVADIKISYTSNRSKRFLKTLNINRYVYVDDITGRKLSIPNALVNYNIPNSSEEYYIPITIINGTGEVEISSYPYEDTKLNIKNAEIINIYDVNFKYCVLSKDKKINKNTLYVDNTAENRTILKNVKAIKIGEIEQNVKKYKINGKYIEIQVEKNAKKFKYPNYFEVIK